MGEIAFPDGEFYSCRDPEELSCTDPIEALVECVDGYLSPDADVARAIREEVGSVTLTAYKRVAVDLEMLARREAEALAENAAERWTEEHGGPDGQMNFSSDAIATFAATIRPALVALYSTADTWNCEPCGSVELSCEQVEQLIRQECPSWFEEVRRG